MNEIGIIQGRLSKRPFPKLQEFPKKSWESEFEKAKQVGFDYIEWIFEEDSFEDNPLWNENGRKKIREQIKYSGIPVKSICADYFLECPIHNRGGIMKESGLSILEKLIECTADIGADVILYPVLEGAKIGDDTEWGVLYDSLKRIIPVLENYRVRLGFESELKNDEYLRLCDQFNTEWIGAYYDSGNCAAKGYNMKADMEVLREKLIQVHIKDRIRNGSSVKLGEGDTDFNDGIPYLVNNGYSGRFTLQSFFSSDPVNEAAENYSYVRRLVYGNYDE